VKVFSRFRFLVTFVLSLITHCFASLNFRLQNAHNQLTLSCHLESKFPTMTLAQYDIKLQWALGVILNHSKNRKLRSQVTFCILTFFLTIAITLTF